MRYKTAYLRVQMKCPGSSIFNFLGVLLVSVVPDLGLLFSPGNWKLVTHKIASFQRKHILTNSLHM